MEVFIILSALLGTVLSDCGPDGIKCCLSEFLPLVSPSGISLTEQKLASLCTVKSTTQTCLADFSDQCVSPTNEELEQSINKTIVFLDKVCQPESQFKKDVRSYEECFQNATETFLTCYNRTLQPEAPLTDDKSKWQAECCDYKELRNCAVQSVENVCGQTASQLIQDEVVNVNGAALELACKDVFSECNSAITTAASAILLLVSFYSINLYRYL